MKIDMTLRRDENGAETDVDVTIELECYAATRGARDSLCGVRGAGPALEPDEPAYCEVLSAVRCDTGEEIDLTDDERERAEEKAMCDAEPDEPFEPEPWDD